MANPMILFYNLNNETGRKLKFICLKHKIKIRNVEKSQYSATIGSLAGISAQISASTDTLSTNDTATMPEQMDFSDEMLVFCGFTDRLLDTFLLEFKKNRIPRIALKAVLTQHNVTWNSYALHAELQREHQEMSGELQ